MRVGAPCGVEGDRADENSRSLHVPYDSTRICAPEQRLSRVGRHRWLDPVLVVERGGCERSSPAGHGRPAEWAGMEAVVQCATFDIPGGPKNLPDSRTFAPTGSIESPPNGEESRFRGVLCLFGGCG